MTNAQEKRRVLDTLDRWRAAMEDGDATALKELWDQSYGSLVFVAMQVEKPLKDWGAISGYYDTLPQHTKDAEWSYEPFVVEAHNDFAYAFCKIRACSGIDGAERRRETLMRNTFVLHHVDGEWKLIHYHESINPAVGLSGQKID